MPALRAYPPALERSLAQTTVELLELRQIRCGLAKGPTSR